MTEEASLLRRLRLARKLQDRAVRLLDETSGDRLLELARFAGHIAWMDHGGAFALPGVEHALQRGPGLELGQARLDPARVARRTLHVLTTAYETGGHTRLARRWIELMGEEPSAVALADQKGAIDPSWIIPSGLDVPLIDLEHEGVRRPLDKVATLRRLMEAAGHVVLHIHPDDACSVAAAHQADGIELRFMNHADHVAWLGAALPAILVGGRSGGPELAVHRRGIHAGACEYLPLPLTPARRLDKDEARRALGIGADEVVLLTVASGYKYLPVEGRSLLEPLSLALRRPEARLIAIGPDAGHPVFAELARRHPGKVRALGIVAKPDLHRAAADIYIDSFPFCSTTSLLESVQLGTPALAYQPDPQELGIFYSDWPTMPRSLFALEDPESFCVRAEELIADPSRREELGERMRSGLDAHLPGPWQEIMAANRRKTYALEPWDDQIPVLEGPLDRTLAGLGQDPFRYPKLSRWPVGPRDKMGVMADRLMGRFGD